MKVSIITVSFNSAKTIADTIESVLSQDFPEIEYIIVDGNSSDDTVQIIRQYENRISKWISEKDQGMYDAMNKGIAMATGDVIGILNSDDIYINTHVISDLMALLEKEKAQVVFADLILVDQNDDNKVLRYYDSSHFHPDKFRFGWMPAHPTVFVRRELYQAVGKFSTTYQIAADYEMLIRMLAIQKASYAYFPKPVVRMRSGGASTAGISRNWILNKEIVRACKENGIYSNMAMLLLKLPYKLWGKVVGKRWDNNS
ncbi:glycosyltransferase family 2 protein [Polynucleobacter sp. IMCC 29146]|uniref:glycosyltransferase family 2 protein n=1 Tax=Polynucleobacter sp. IMCC 29146 TaxID=2780953 RepID=UPI001F2596A0|nr:glycosyltransferase family 2 protein [Polynucleobacter sp. IMCC 29146]MCE7530510.1 glycosyltransferase [Polynucleobacter sp. IMCC 29146]